MRRSPPRRSRSRHCWEVDRAPGTLGSMNGYEQEQEWDAFPPGTVPPQQPWPAYQQWPVPGPGYGPQYGPGWWHPSLAWPDGPERPAAATTAAVLGFVTGGLTLLFSVLDL